MSFLDGTSRITRYASRVPEMAARLAGTGLVAGRQAEPAQWQTVPLLRKSALRALQAAAPPWGGLLAEGFHPDACFMSPGGIVEPLEPRMVERLAEMLAGAGFGAEHVVLNGFGYHYTPAGLLFHGALVRAGCTVLPGGPQNTAMQAEFAQALGANAFVGIASHLKILFDHQPMLRIRLAMAGAEPHVEALRAALTSAHGVRCVDMYGFAEAGVVAVSCAEAGALHLHDDALVEVLEPGTGEPLAEGAEGELVLSLDNPGFPLLRFASGDLVCLDPAVCACGRRSALRVIGRADESARVKGMLLHASQVRQFIANSGVGACRVVLTRDDDRDRVDVTVRSSGGAADAQSLEAAFREVCRLRSDRFAVDPELAADVCLIDDQRGSSAR